VTGFEDVEMSSPVQFLFRSAQSAHPGIIIIRFEIELDLIWNWFQSAQLNGVLMEVGQTQSKISAADFFDINLSLIPTVSQFSLTRVNKQINRGLLTRWWLIIRSWLAQLWHTWSYSINKPTPRPNEYRFDVPVYFQTGTSPACVNCWALPWCVI